MNSTEGNTLKTIRQLATELDQALSHLTAAVALLPPDDKASAVEQEVWAECDRLSLSGEPIVAAQLARKFRQRSESRIREYVRAWRAARREPSHVR
ncbi:hypothetical protein JOF29_005690 [Kribbella aluminosa]|uniref:Uncharacterized protein n=1 Tax=Kribbella aluminosa TaxID=416017 RepID=A0ABS4USF7_9ACTN|nr:hypothetical protein [Kribbella aluminosa]MBP2354580.1 hypothetical protein [Kribbella aluminosa]